MKEVTEWNGKPRWMWVWDDSSGKNPIKKYVICILTEEQMKESGADYPVNSFGVGFYHCAEIEEEKRPCTREELIEMLKKQGLPILKSSAGNCCFTIKSIGDNNVYINENRSYESLCENYTLLDGTELWVKNVPPERISPTPDKIDG